MMRMLLFVCLIWIAFTVQYVTAATPQQVKQRSIVSEYFTQNRPKSNKRTKSTRKSFYQLASKPLPESTTEKVQIGVTIWELRRAFAAHSSKSQLISRRVAAEKQFRDGDLLRLSIESPQAGYLYVIDRDLFTDGSSGKTNLIFPTRDEDNRLEAGKLIDIPGQDQLPFQATPASNQNGEMLTFIVTSAPLPLTLTGDAMPISSRQLAEWEDSFGGLSERFEMVGGVGQTRTTAELLAAASGGSRTLTPDDPSPQTIYILSPKSSDGFLFNLMLSYRR